MDFLAFESHCEAIFCGNKVEINSCILRNHTSAMLLMAESIVDLLQITLNHSINIFYENSFKVTAEFLKLSRFYSVKISKASA